MTAASSAPIAPNSHVLGDPAITQKTIQGRKPAMGFSESCCTSDRPVRRATAHAGMFAWTPVVVGGTPGTRFAVSGICSS
jgi:hypothetical protein